MGDVSLDSFKTLYFTTAEENIANLQKSLAILLEDLASAVGIEEVYRNAHTLKSKSLVMGYTNTGNASGVIENIFFQIKNGEVLLTQKIVGEVQKLVNDIQQAIIAVKEGKTEVAFDSQVLQIQQLMEKTQ